MATTTYYMGYQIRPMYYPFRNQTVYEVYAENHNHNGSVTWEKTAGGYSTLNAAKAACQAHFGRL